MIRNRARRCALSFSLAAVVMGLGVSCGTPATPPGQSTSPLEPGGSTPAASSPSTQSSSAESPSEESTPTEPGGSTPSDPQQSAGNSCADLTASLSLAEQVGQLIMIAVDSEVVTDADLSILNEAKAGSVLLLQNTETGVEAVRALTDRVTDAVDTPKKIKIIMAIDQEGGQVQRLQGAGFDDIPSAVEQAELPDDQLAKDAEHWGEQLKEAGINTDLAPVADVVPQSMVDANEPVGKLQRGYGSDPKIVGRKVRAFVDGMDKAGLATAVKHFPGLGRVRGNTDFTAGVDDTVTTRNDPKLKGFEAAVDAGVDMVMMSSARYTRIDPDNLAPFSKKIINKMVREDLGFDGVVISDDLNGEAVADLPVGERALRFLNAGGDLMIMGDIAQAPEMIKAVKAEAKADPEFAAAVESKATRVVQLKADRGLADCS